MKLKKYSKRTKNIIEQNFFKVDSRVILRVIFLAQFNLNPSSTLHQQQINLLIILIIKDLIMFTHMKKQEYFHLLQL